MVAVQKWHFPVGFYPNLESLSRVSGIQKGVFLTLYFAYCARKSKADICSLNFPLLLNLPKHVPAVMRLGRATDSAKRMEDSDT
jgi:hypothetical protein